MRKVKFILGVILSILLVWTSPLTQKIYAQGEYTTRPPLNGWRIAGELAAGVVGSFFALVVIGLPMWYFRGEEAGGEFMIYAGTALCSSLGVYAVGNIGAQTGSYKATLGCSLLGELPAILIFHIIPHTEDWVEGLGFFTTFFGTVPLGATIGFNLTRRYKSSFKTGDALINFREGRLRLGIPRMYLRPSSFDQRNLIQNIDLIRGRF